jgi:hypothetical protein
VAHQKYGRSGEIRAEKPGDVAKVAVESGISTCRAARSPLTRRLLKGLPGFGRGDDPPSGAVCLLSHVGRNQFPNPAVLKIQGVGNWQAAEIAERLAATTDDIPAEVMAESAACFRTRHAGAVQGRCARTAVAEAGLVDRSDLA